MTAATLLTRIGRLIHRLRIWDPDECHDGLPVILDAGEPIPADAARCPQCGAVHVQVIEEQIAERSEAKRAADATTERPRRTIGSRGQ